jgi:signal peptidase I
MTTVEKRNRVIFYLVLLAALLLLNFTLGSFVKPYKISSPAMNPTLMEGDRLFVNTKYYKGKLPQRGDLVIFQTPDTALSEKEKEQKVKRSILSRCVAVAGDTVEIRNKKLILNQQEINEEHVQITDKNAFVAKDLKKLPGKFQENWEKGLFATMSFRLVRDNFGPVVVPEGCIFVLSDNRDISFDSRYWGPLKLNLLEGKPMIIYFSKNLLRIGKVLR